MSGPGIPTNHKEAAPFLDAHELVEDFFHRTGRYPNQDSLHLAYCGYLWQAVQALRKVRECILTAHREQQEWREKVNCPEYRPK